MTTPMFAPAEKLLVAEILEKTASLLDEKDHRITELDAKIRVLEGALAQEKRASVDQAVADFQSRGLSAADANDLANILPPDLLQKVAAVTPQSSPDWGMGRAADTVDSSAVDPLEAFVFGS